MRVFVVVAMLLVVPAAMAFEDTSIYWIQRTIFNGTAGNITDIIAGSGLQGGGSSGDVTLAVDSTVCRANGTNCLPSGTGNGNMSLWRFGADMGADFAVYNNSLVEVLGGTGISTSIINGVLTITNDGVIDEVDPVWSADKPSYSTTAQANALYVSTLNGTLIYNNLTLYYLASNPLAYINTSGELDRLWSGNESTVCRADGTNCPPSGVNSSWNESRANALYAPIGEPLWSGNLTGGNLAVNITGNSTGASVAYNLSCADCLDQSQIRDIYVLNTGDTIAGSLNVTGRVNASEGVVTPQESYYPPFITERVGQNVSSVLLNSSTILTINETNITGTEWSFTPPVNVKCMISSAVDVQLNTVGSGAMAVSIVMNGVALPASNIISLSTVGDRMGAGQVNVVNLTGGQQYTFWMRGGIVPGGTRVYATRQSHTGYALSCVGRA